MNIFVLDTDPVKAARLLCDKHLNKMILESAQMLSTVMWEHVPQIAETLHDRGLCYKPTHVNHPCTKWAGATRGNFEWLVKHAQGMAAERKHRWPDRAPHKSSLIVDAALVPSSLRPGRTAFALAMPDEYKVAGYAVKSYRNYYKGKKHGMASYTNRPTPKFMR